MEGRILVVDDERLTRVTLEVELQDAGFGVTTVENAYRALELLETGELDVIVTDLRMPSMDGLEFQRKVRERWPDTAIIFATAFGTVASAVEAMREGAADYLTKPLNAEELLIRIRRLVQRRREIVEIRKLREDVARSRIAGDLVYRSPGMAAVVERALSVADTEITVLIEGETGTGKEVLARWIHGRSSRSAGPFVAVNCAGLNPNLIESELFGHVAGAFTGASRHRCGRLESASGGTLFVDEVDDLTPEIQVRLLRFLNDRAFERVGSDRTLRADVRVLTATKHSLSDLVASGRFRSDLYYRINTVLVQLPPLRARKEDVLPLAEHFAAKFRAVRDHGSPPELLPETMRALLAHDWPGNIRELEHVLEHAVAFSRGAPIGLPHLPSHFSGAAPAGILGLDLEGMTDVSFAEVVASCERRLIEWALARTGGNQVKAAEMLRMSRTTFRSRLAALRGEPGDACE